MSLNASKLIKVSLCLLAIAIAVGAMLLRQRNQLMETQVVLVKKGMSASQVIRHLKSSSIIESDLPIRIWAKVDFRKIQEGEYLIPPRATLFEIISIIWGGHSTFVELVIPEGTNSWQIEKLLKDYVPKDQFWSLWTDPELILLTNEPLARNLEGLLAPNTYYINHAMEPVDIIKMLAAGSKKYYPPRQIKNGLSPYETLILASLIESEATMNSERERIASVFLNRLKKGIPLQCDPTVQYSKFKLGLPNPLRIGGTDLRRSHPYNTYRISGLPPGPICSPGLPSMQAAAKPSTTEELYFVADGNGTHVFSATLEDHLKAVQAYRKIQAEKKLNNQEKP
jgi:UPF0755 protein